MKVGKAYLMYCDRRHWSLDVGRYGVYRWCPGASCHLAGVAYATHRIRAAKVDR
jgi:hypothetical protein